MIIDAQNLCSNAQTLAGAAGTVASTNSIHIGAQNTTPRGNTPIQDIGRAQWGEFYAQINKTVVGAGTLQCQLIESNNADLSAPDVLQSSAAIAVAELVPGYRFRMGKPVGFKKPYAGFQYVRSGTLTDGEVTSGYNIDQPTNAPV